jgi:hypothetical protein
MRNIETRAKAVGLTICNEGPTCWYALLPGETEFRHVERRDGSDDMNYIGFFRSKDQLCSELERILDSNLLGFPGLHARV